LVSGRDALEDPTALISQRSNSIFVSRELLQCCVVVAVFKMLGTAQKRERRWGDRIDNHDNFCCASLHQSWGLRRIFSLRQERLQRAREVGDGANRIVFWRERAEIGKEEMACCICGPGKMSVCACLITAHELTSPMCGSRRRSPCHLRRIQKPTIPLSATASCHPCHWSCLVQLRHTRDRRSRI
jgi:hypothetical protein